MEVKSEIIAEIIRKVDGNHSMGAGALADAIMAELEKDRELSDLEIVQKALAKTGFVIWMNSKDFSVCDDNRGEVVIEFGSFESLLTWAKQTIGDQS